MVVCGPDVGVFDDFLDKGFFLLIEIEGLVWGDVCVYLVSKVRAVRTVVNKCRSMHNLMLYVDSRRSFSF